MSGSARYHPPMSRPRSLRAGRFASLATSLALLALPAIPALLTPAPTLARLAVPADDVEADDTTPPATDTASTEEAPAPEATPVPDAAPTPDAEPVLSLPAAPAGPPAAPPDAPGGELDPRAASGPAFGTRAAVAQSEPMAMRRVGQPDAVDPELPVALSFFASLGVVMPSSYDDALQSHAYGRSSPTTAVDGSLTYAVTRWLHLGGRVGARGRGWIRRDGDFGMTSGIDALAIAHGRLHFGPVVDVGLVLGGGVGLSMLSIHRSTLYGVSPRLHASLQIGFRVARGFHLFLRGAWDYFPWNDLDRYGSDIDLGGPLVGLGIEVKT